MKNIAILIFVVSFTMYICSPHEYNWWLCSLSMCFFFINALTCIAYDFKNRFYLSFNLLFSLSFFFTTFAYPVFLKNVYGSSLFLIEYVDDRMITPSTLLAQLAFSTYSLFYVLTRKKEQNIFSYRRSIILDFFIKRQVLMFLLFISVIFFFIEFFLLKMKDAKTINFEGGQSITLILVFVNLFSILSFFYFRESYSKKRLLIKHNYLFLILLSIVVFALLSIGDRGVIINIILLLASSYTYFVKRIKLKILVPIFVIGLMTMAIIGQVRGSNTSVTEKIQSNKGENYWVYFEDLTVISRNLYNGYEYGLSHNKFYPAKIFIIPFASIPFLPSFLANLIYAKPYGDLSSSTIITSYSANQASFNVLGGLGTHCVADIYISWGVLGIVFFFGILGFSIAYFQNNLQQSLFACFFYFIYVAYAIYIPRATLYSCFDIALKSVLVYLILQTFIKRLK